MAALTQKKKLQVVFLFFSGLSFDQIAAKTGISKGSVTNIITELKAGNFPEAVDVTDQIDALRELAVNLDKLKMTVGKAVVGVALLSRIYELNLEPADMDKWPLLLNSIKSQDNAQELIEAAYVVRGIQQETGLSLVALEDKVKNLGQKAKELESVASKINEAKIQGKDLTAKNEKLVTDVTALEYKFNLLTPRVQELELREAGLLNHHKIMLKEESEAKTTIATLNLQFKKLQKTGLTVQGLVDFNEKLEIVANHHGMKPSAIRERLLHELKSLDKGIGLETTVKNQQQLLIETNQAIKKSKHEKLSLEAVLGNLRQEEQNIEASIKQTRDCVSYEIAQLIPLAQNTMQQITADLKNGCSEALSNVYQLKEESIKVGQDMGHYKGILAESEWLKKLMPLVNGSEDNIGASDIRTIALLVNQGITAWLKQHGEKSNTVGLLAIDAQTFLTELEKWQT
jgi:hypothetical protein